MNSPIISFRNATTPYALLSAPYTYSETVAKMAALPVLTGDNSDSMMFRIYNNFNTPPSTTIATAFNVVLTTYDSVAVLTASTQPVSNMWIHFQENGFGEQSSIPGLYYVSQDTDTAVGGGNSTYSPSYGSDSSSVSRIRAGTDTNGVGFIEVYTFAAVPLGVITNTWTFGIV